jgi:hypothetical protein
MVSASLMPVSTVCSVLSARLVMAFKRGDIVVIGRLVEAVILGGPMVLCSERYYTIRYLGNVIGGNGAFMWTKGHTTLMHECAGKYVRHDDKSLITSGRHENVIYNYCSECDEGEMIFYEGDYICAWCREHFEDEVW